MDVEPRDAWIDFFWQMPEWARERVKWLSDNNPGMLAVDLMSVLLPELKSGDQRNPDGSKSTT